MFVQTILVSLTFVWKMVYFSLYLFSSTVLLKNYPVMSDCLYGLELCFLMFFHSNLAIWIKQSSSGFYSNWNKYSVPFHHLFSSPSLVGFFLMVHLFEKIFISWEFQDWTICFFSTRTIHEPQINCWIMPTFIHGFIQYIQVTVSSNL